MPEELAGIYRGWLVARGADRAPGRSHSSTSDGWATFNVGTEESCMFWAGILCALSVPPRAVKCTASRGRIE